MYTYVQVMRLSSDDFVFSMHYHEELLRVLFIAERKNVVSTKDLIYGDGKPGFMTSDSHLIDVAVLHTYCIRP